MNIAIIGCGGGGAWVAQALARTPDIDPCTLTLVDGDRIEEHNLDRQLFNESNIGEFKALVLKCLLDNMGHTPFERVDACFNYVDPGDPPWAADQDSVFLCVDNHPARKYTLALADRHGFRVFNAANDHEGCEAWAYSSFMQGTAVDPRVRFPELITDTTGDPLRPCTGDAERGEHPQTSIANMGSAFMALQLWRCWYGERTLDTANMPIHHMANFARCRTLSVGEAGEVLR